MEMPVAELRCRRSSSNTPVVWQAGPSDRIFNGNASSLLLALLLVTLTLVVPSLPVTLMESKATFPQVHWALVLVMRCNLPVGLLHRPCPPEGRIARPNPLLVRLGRLRSTPAVEPLPRPMLVSSPSRRSVPFTGSVRGLFLVAMVPS